MQKHLSKVLVLRIVDGEEPLDNTAIHPESYDVAYRMLHQLDLTAQDIGSVKLKIRYQMLIFQHLCLN